MFSIFAITVSCFVKERYILMIVHFEILGIPALAYIYAAVFWKDRLRSLMVRVPGYRYRGPGFDSRSYQIF
jgi:hypothetical protein